MATNETNSHLPLFPSTPLPGGAVPVLARPGSVRQSPSIEERQETIERVYAEADENFIAGYRNFLIWFADRVDDFIAGDVTERFEKSFRKLKPRETKQLGGLYQVLQKEGVIEKTGGYRKRDQGSPAAVYRLKK